MGTIKRQISQFLWCLPFIAILWYWQRLSNIWIVSDDVEFWLQAHQRLAFWRAHGLSGLTKIFLLNDFGRPSIHYLFGLPFLALSGGDTTAATELWALFFWSGFVFLTFKTFLLLTGHRLLSFLFTGLIATHPLYFQTTVSFMSELPYLFFLALAAHSGLCKRLGLTCAALGLAIALRPLEGFGIFLFLTAAVGFVLWREKKTSLLTFLLPWVTVALSALWLRALCKPDLSLPASALLPAALPLLLPLALHLLQRDKTYALLVATPLALAGLWYAPRFRDLLSWILAGTFAQESAAALPSVGEFLKSSLLYLGEVFYSFLGWHGAILLLAVLLTLALRKASRESTLRTLALGAMLVAMIVAAGLTKNESSRLAYHRYFLGPFFLFFLSAFDSLAHAQKKFVPLLAGLCLLPQVLVFSNLFFDIPRGYANTYPWMVKVSALILPQRPFYFTKGLVEALEPLIPGEAQIFAFAESEDITPSRSALKLRAFELRKPWEFNKNHEFFWRALFQTGGDFSFVEKFKPYQYILIGPLKEHAPTSGASSHAARFVRSWAKDGKGQKGFQVLQRIEVSGPSGEQWKFVLLKNRG
ncbi:MAG TPA: hypothetical protein VIH99_09750 [Bdellovibrionota bacterium]|jgi:hypothetical protein